METAEMGLIQQLNSCASQTTTFTCIKASSIEPYWDENGPYNEGDIAIRVQILRDYRWSRDWLLRHMKAFVGDPDRKARREALEGRLSQLQSDIEGSKAWQTILRKRAPSP